MTTSAPGQPGQPDQPHTPGAGQTWAWVKPTPEIRTVETEPLEYHRLYRGAPGYRWWKPLLVLVLAAVFYVIFSLVVSGVWVGIVTANNPDLFATTDPYAAAEALSAELALDTQNPFAVFMNLLSVILMIPSVLLAMLCLGIRPLARVWSVACRIRWGFLGRTLVIAVVAVIVMNGVGMLADWALNPVSVSEPVANQTADFDWTAALLSMLVVLVLVPFQATAEEVVFRGMGMQIIGAWLKNPWFAILIPSVAFALAHIYDVWGMAAVGLMGVAAAWLTWKTGGLEAAISIHVINNIAAFGFMAAGITGETAQVEESGGAATVIGEIAGLAVYVWLTHRSFTKRRLGRTRIDLVQIEVPATAVPDGQAPEAPGAPPAPSAPTTPGTGA